eukprot:CAMPEP_0170516176 /NCGR_PEP_ID=MMETSP0209-20121228/2476_1 /TAXON_ID=665100 ORGANISM="Litonotus pictus, Strain P1" /NCGR_SAMPLE_ID=MMETSP0209 /ASSEMBLY_ACC=CAM_ASM_000301 /LENGTH=85 /DNA_ID=CAMNT_0010800975 /DNA_START=900 /DNA_END=1157 /DNA_ORIENTATION=+
MEYNDGQMQKSQEEGCYDEESVTQEIKTGSLLRIVQSEGKVEVMEEERDKKKTKNNNDLLMKFTAAVPHPKDKLRGQSVSCSLHD